MLVTFSALLQGVQTIAQCQILVNGNVIDTTDGSIPSDATQEVPVALTAGTTVPAGQNNTIIAECQTNYTASTGTTISYPSLTAVILPN
jgi:hypothetical protein